MLSGLIASQIAFAGKSLLSFKVQVLSFLIFFVVIVLSPLTVFAPTLWRAKLQGAAEFGQLAVRYNRRFEQKWVHGDAPPDDDLLGSADIQSLADLGNSHSVVQEIRLFPFGWRDVTRLISVAASPLLPLLLTIFSLEEVADYITQDSLLTEVQSCVPATSSLRVAALGGLGLVGHVGHRHRRPSCIRRKTRRRSSSRRTKVNARRGPSRRRASILRSWQRRPPRRHRRRHPRPSRRNPPDRKVSA